ncbi:MAG: complex I NDUFA9 subunit family protein [Gammaproteobacteria bacterium]
MIQTMADAVITIFGGTGFLGSALVKRLLTEGYRVRVAVRDPGKAKTLLDEEHSARIEAVSADVRDRGSVAKALIGAAAAVNAVGHYVEYKGASFHDVHVRGAENLAREASRAGVTRFIHLSGIGAELGSASRYIRARAEGELAVKDAFPGATLFRLSVVFGPGDALFRSLANMIRRLPVIPLFGRGETLLQPVYVMDVADAAVAALQRTEAKGMLYELGGPKAYSYRALVEFVAKELHRKRVLIPLPFLFWEAAAALLGVMPNPPLTRDQVALLKQDNTVNPSRPDLKDLGIEPTSLEKVVPLYLA